MRTNIYKTLAFFFIVMSVACKKEVLSVDTIEFTGNEIVLSSDADTTVVNIEPKGPWRIKYATTDWFKTDILGGPNTQKSFKIIHQKNEQDNIRTTDIIIYAENGSFQDTITVLQLSRFPTILIAQKQLEINSSAKPYSVRFETNIPEVSIQIETAYHGTPSDWIENVILSDRTITFDVLANMDSEARVGEINLLHTDDYGRHVKETITVTQSPHADIDNAQLRSISSIKALAQGTITENIYISGHIVSNGQSTNFKSNRYILQDENNQAICFESNGSLVFNEFDKVDLWLKDVQITKASEGSFTYNVISNVTPTHVINSDASTFTPAELTISAIGDSHLFALVTLKDVEISSPHGAFTNFKKSIAPGNPSPNFMERFPSYYLSYPTSIRDINGDNMYMLTNPSANFAVQALPQGSGKITGIIVREKLTNFDIKESQYSIRPLKREAVNLQSNRTNSFTNVLVEWNCLLSGLSTTTHTTFIPPTIGSNTAVLYKTNTSGFAGTRINNTSISPQDEFRGNVGNDGRVNGAMNCLGWTVNDYWYIDKVATTGINSLLSLQIETNNGWAAVHANMVVEYAFDMAGPWTKIPNGDFVSIGQFDRTAAQGQTANHIPGYKVYDFKLPNELNNKANICLRIRPTVALTTTHRLANVSIKYNK